MNLGPHDWAALANTLKSVHPDVEVTDQFELKGCGANKPGGGGFAAGNTCARGVGSGGGTIDKGSLSYRMGYDDGYDGFQVNHHRIPQAGGMPTPFGIRDYDAGWASGVADKGAGRKHALRKSS